MRVKTPRDQTRLSLLRVGVRVPWYDIPPVIFVTAPVETDNAVQFLHRNTFTWNA
jgi:hypothetical protein